MDAGRADPDHAEVYNSSAATTVIAAPVTSDERRIGVLSIYADRAPIFVEDDLWLLELLAGHTAVLLESRKIATAESSLRAREDSARLKEEFLSAAAHDLRTPLTVVLGQAELLERRLERNPTEPVDLAGVTRLAREARRLRDLVNELLDAQRLEEGATVMERSPADLRTVVESVRHRYHDQGIDLKATLPSEPLVGSIDVTRLEQVLDNLIENALKYASGGVLPEVHLEQHDGEARLSVVDHGLGVPEDEAGRIFDRFYRATNVQSITDTGIGLGLYICRRVVESHGGRIWVEPTPGGGSTFVVTIPAVPDVPEPDPQPVPPGWSAGTEVAADA
jgi:signal transduction histidine kinase